MKKLLARKGAAQTLAKFKQFNFPVTGAKHLAQAVSKNTALKRAISKVFSVKGAVAVAGATGIGVAVTKINEYVKTNSGCFKIVNGQVNCKVRALSCCNKSFNDEIPFCSDNLVDPCAGFDETNEKSCCRMCDCISQACPPGTKLECRRATVGEALTFFLGRSTLVQTVMHLLKWIGVAFVLLIAVVLMGRYVVKLRWTT